MPLLVASLAGCATTKQNPDGPRVVVDGDQYVTLEAPVGSHMKRRVKLSELREPGISPSRKDIITADTDTTILPPTAAEMERMVSDRPSGP